MKWYAVQVYIASNQHPYIYNIYNKIYNIIRFIIFLQKAQQH